MNGSFYTPLLVADAEPWTACQAAGGHLARLCRQCPEVCGPPAVHWGGWRLRLGTRQPQQVMGQTIFCCPDESMKEDTCGHQMSFSLCSDTRSFQCGCCLLASVQGWIHSVRSGWVSDSAVVRLLQWSNNNCMWLCPQPPVGSADPKQICQLTHDSSLLNPQLPKALFGISEQNRVLSQPGFWRC